MELTKRIDGCYEESSVFHDGTMTPELTGL